MPISLQINGQPHRTGLDADTPLIHLLREELELSGTRHGCGMEQCGACVVLVDGTPCYACSALIGDLQGRTVDTVESLAGIDGSLHPLQSAFLQENAAQCGFCTSGILMRASALLEANPRPSREQICTALDPHLCRCGAQPRMLRAIEHAARAMQRSS